MLWAAILLAGAALVRFLVATPGPAEPPLQDRPSIADSLLAAGDSVVEDKDRRSRPFGPGETIDPNVAGEVDLDRLPGVGVSKALRIVQDRERNGLFASVEDLARVPGLGTRSVERLRPFLRIRSGAARIRAAGPSAAGSWRSPLSAPVHPTVSRPAGGPIDLNRATAAELEKLPGIGPVMAGRIVAFRSERGRFAAAGELMEVPGVGAKTFARIAPLVTVRR